MTAPYDDIFETRTEGRHRGSRRQAREQRRVAKDGNKVKPLVALNDSQKDYLEALSDSKQVFSIGGAGTGKTYIAARWAMSNLLKGSYEKIAITRPMVAKPKHRMGFLPGGPHQKMEPWLVPITQAFKEECSGVALKAMMQNETVEIVPFEFMRGRSIPNAIIILDEAQNCDLGDLKMFLTRVGENSQVIICGDTDQIDIPDSGLEDILDMIEVHDIDADVIEFKPEDVVRSAIAKEWVVAFDRIKRDREGT
jgi:phosphate starvation-inducible protein PhoH and related proteins